MEIRPVHIAVGLAAAAAAAFVLLKPSSASAATPAGPQIMAGAERAAAIKAMAAHSATQATYPPDPANVVWGIYEPPTDGTRPFQKVLRIEPLPQGADATAAGSLLQALLALNAQQVILATKDGKYVTASAPDSHIVLDYAFQGGPWFILAAPGELSAIVAQAGL
jgi:hypothetical protein